MTRTEKIARYDLLNAQLAALLATQSHLISNLANASALLMETLPDSVFAGFYLYDGQQLVLGPFQGSVSCVEITMGAGVCGEAAAAKRSVIVEDVTAYKNYISCDSRAKSELVVPLLSRDNELLGVIDLDAPTVSAYDDADQAGLEAFAQILVKNTDWKLLKELNK